MKKHLVIALLSPWVFGLASAATQPDPANLRHAQELLQQHPVIDGHNDLPYVIREFGKPMRDVAAYDLRKTTPHDTDLARLHEGRVGGQFWSVFIPSTDDTKRAGFARIQLEQIDIARRVIERYPEALQLALTADDIERANKAGRIASLLGVEGGHAIENSLGALRIYYGLGVRYMTLTHFKGNDWADSATDVSRHGGLTKFGQEVVREMNRLGMLVDLSHVSPDTMNDALDVTTAPVIFSHSNAKGLTPHPRNVPDQVLRRLPQNGGVVMASFISPFTVKASLQKPWEEGFSKASGGVQFGDEKYDAARDKYVTQHPEPRATLADVADHIEYLRKVAGIEHVAIGSDFYGNKEGMAAGLEDTSRYPVLFAELIRRGWSDADLIKLSRGNILKALRGAEQAAAKLQQKVVPSIRTIEEIDGGQAQPNLN
ncbi:dipeptidase [Steroidobacter sp.]|uniref:dipeptidase n=1 Tax=Steroidobacter sp. TaxID=1978227 RepID=UPI001A628638|nr:dipeptidase [Steroidobacter sp.]MBL8266809.1 dipeptidase [Steroidobacter sp.]